MLQPLPPNHFLSFEYWHRCHSSVSHTRGYKRPYLLSPVIDRNIINMAPSIRISAGGSNGVFSNAPLSRDRKQCSFASPLASRILSGDAVINLYENLILFSAIQVWSPTETYAEWAIIAMAEMMQHFCCYREAPKCSGTEIQEMMRLQVSERCQHSKCLTNNEYVCSALSHNLWKTWKLPFVYPPKSIHHECVWERGQSEPFGQLGVRKAAQLKCMVLL